ncbi:MAG: glutathione S-transferase family protein [Hyphomicrobiaceae bacterium]
MLTIYGVYRSRATRNIWLAEELGIPFKSVPVTQGYRLKDPLAKDAPLNTQSPDFLKINPNGHVPSADIDGLVMHESLAINLYLAKKHGGPLAPANLQEDAMMTMWTIWAITEVEGLALQVMRNRVALPEVERDTKAATAAVEALKKPFAILNDALASGHLVGGRFTVADINVAECVRYAQSAPELFTGAPKVKAWLDACHARPAFKKMMATRDAEPA